MIYIHSAFQELFRMEADPEMQPGSSWGSSRRIFHDAIRRMIYGIFSVLGMPEVDAVTQDVVHPRLQGIS